MMRPALSCLEGVRVGAQAFASSWAISLVLRLLEVQAGGGGGGRRGLSCSVLPASSPLEFPSCSRELDGPSGGQRSTLDTRWLRGSVKLAKQGTGCGLSPLLSAGGLHCAIALPAHCQAALMTGRRAVGTSPGAQPSSWAGFALLSSQSHQG